MNIKEKIKKLPSSPGVYLMKDSLDTILYVGKSKNLRNRVGSYFINSKSRSPKVIKLAKNLKDFDYLLTDTEFEALLLECKLIKEMKPIYNRLLKNQKSYCYIKLEMNNKYPDFEICSEPIRSDGTLYFGPYKSKNTVSKALTGIKEHSKILCTNISKKSSGCPRYAMNMCIGMCTNVPSVEDYSALVEKIIKLLNGTDFSILQEMEQNMNICASNFDFECAAKYRDYIRAVRHLTNTAKVISFIDSSKNIALAELLNDHEVKFIFMRYSKLLFMGTYNLDDSGINELKSEIKCNMAIQFGNALKKTDNIGVNEIDEVQIIYSYLKSKASKCKYLPIQQQWIDTMDTLSIDRAVDALISDLLN